MQSASDTPSSHSRRVGAQPKRGLWAAACGGAPTRSGANRGTIGCRPARVPAARDRPAGYHERRRDTPVRAAYAEVENRLQPPSTLGGGCFGVLRGWAMLRREGVPWKSRFGP